MLNVFGCKAIFAVLNLVKHSVPIPDTAVVLDKQILNGLDQLPLNVPCSGGLDGCVDQPVPASHSMEEELSDCKPFEEIICDESS